MGDAFNGASNLIEPSGFEHIKDISNKTFYIYPFNAATNPCFFMFKKVTNDRIFDLANHIVSEDMYIKAMGGLIENMPVFNIEKAKNILKVNDNLEIIDNYNISSKVKEIINHAYELIIKNEYTSKEITDTYFSNDNYNTTLRFYIRDIIHDIARELSGEKLSLEKFNINNEKANKILDEKISDFVINFNIQNN